VNVCFAAWKATQGRWARSEVKGPARVAKFFDSAHRVASGLLWLPDPGDHWSTTMSEKTCAACDYRLDDNAIEVRIGGQTVEVCCEDCAAKLTRAHASATASQPG
jgi:hypothetical protein